MPHDWFEKREASVARTYKDESCVFRLYRCARGLRKGGSASGKRGPEAEEWDWEREVDEREAEEWEI